MTPPYTGNSIRSPSTQCSIMSSTAGLYYALHVLVDIQRLEDHAVRSGAWPWTELRAARAEPPSKWET